jgi:hypothetical protein
VIYIAVGAAFGRAASASARSIRRIHPDLPIALFADAAAQDDARVRDCFDRVLPIANPHRRSKVDYLGDSPFARTLYLDADTRVVAPIGDVFDVLERFDVALSHAHARNRERTNQVWRQELPASFPQFNGGVIAYRDSPEVKRFLTDWRESFHAAGFRKDQVTLRELLWSSSLRIATLPPEYNLRRPAYLAFWRRREAAPRILHLKSFTRDGARARVVERTLRALARRPWDAAQREAGRT